MPIMPKSHIAMRKTKCQRYCKKVQQQWADDAPYTPSGSGSEDVGKQGEGAERHPQHILTSSSAVGAVSDFAARDRRRSRKRVIYIERRAGQTGRASMAFMYGSFPRPPRRAKLARAFLETRPFLSVRSSTKAVTASRVASLMSSNASTSASTPCTPSPTVVCVHASGCLLPAARAPSVPSQLPRPATRHVSCSSICATIERFL